MRYIIRLYMARTNEDDRQILFCRDLPTMGRSIGDLLPIRLLRVRPR